MSDLKPEIRFQGFKETWKHNYLGNVAKIYDGTHQTPKYADKGVKFVSVENIKNISSSKKYISKEDYVKNFKIKPRINDIFMTRITAGVIGDTAIVVDDIPLAYYVSLALIRPEKISPVFLEKYINTDYFKNELYKRIIHTAFPKKINLGDISKCNIHIPISDLEQECIGRFFKEFNETIELNQHGLNLLKQRKNAFLQKMFPKKGESIPALQFSDSKCSWKKTRMKEILTERKLKEIPSVKSPLVSFTVEKGVTPKSDRYNREFLVRDNEKKYKFTKYNDIVYNPANLKFGAISRNKYGNAVFSPIYVTFETNQDPKFVELLVTRQRFINKALKYQEGTVYERQAVKPKDFLEVETFIPEKKEQEKIGNFFKELDNTITLQEEKLESLKQMKKAFLQKMFV